MDDRFHLEDGDLPPPYSASANPDARSHSASLLSSHVAGLRDRISASQAARASARDDRDGYVLSLIVPYLEDFLSSVSQMDPTPRLAEATLVPDAAISEDWKFSDEDEKRGGEFRTLIRVRETQKKKKQADGGAMPSRPEKSSARSAPSDGTGSRPMIPPLWWESENAARRLAKHLQPERPAAAKSAPMLRDGDCGASSNKKSGLWGLFKKSDKAAQQVVPPTTEGSGDGVTMTARAEEVTFRRENELGIWETMTGWGIVVRVRIQST
ncbi:nad-dependent epimerase dehydratase family [Trichoderma cornu-damae]|uniref:Nad-dependent epimerase dehydratase family n=1 Tax=Trichoderma cornu-damae TaxID=654480 RepID=A0A9P8QS86_9HYPO|nr:nad-dependent epimerase dehydratase family [Trichoderma cornu-damae]